MMNLWINEQKISSMSIEPLHTVGQVKKSLNDWLISQSILKYNVRLFFHDKLELNRDVFKSEKYDGITFQSKADQLNGNIYITEGNKIVKITGDPTRRNKIQTKQLRPKPNDGYVPKMLVGNIFPELPADNIEYAIIIARRNVNQKIDQTMKNLMDAPIVSPTIFISQEVLNQTLPNVPLKDHQMKAIKHMMRNRGLIAVHSIGSGKTLIGATVALCFLRMDVKHHVIFIGPKSLLDNFRQTLLKFFPTFNIDRISYFTYEKFQIDYNKGLINCYDTFLIVDEAHRLRTKIGKKKIKGKTVRTMFKAARKASKVLLLTATPVVNDPYDIVNLVTVIRGELRPMDRRTFHRTIFKDDKLFDFNNYFGGCMNFHEKIHDETYPMVLIHTTEIEMDQKYLEEYTRIELQQLHDLQRDILGESDLKPFYNGIRRAVNADIEEYNPKLDWVRLHLLRFNNRKMVIFSPFISLGVSQLERLVMDFDIKPSIGIITGDNSEEERQETIKSYNSDHIQILIISIGAGGLGINLIGTRDVVIMQPGWNDVEMEQAMGRAIRFHSHTHLPYDEQRVEVWKLLLVKPDKGNVAGNGNEDLAADQIIENIARKKKVLIEPFMKLLIKL